MRFRTPASVVVAKLALAAWLLAAAPALAGDRSLEYAVKATFLYKFAPFVEWPASSFGQPASPFVLCVVGDDPFGDAIDKAVAGQHVGEHPVVLRRLAAADAGSNCHVMFVAGSPAQSVAQALDAVRGSATLTVTDSSIGPTPGIVQFVIVNDRVNFDVDAVAAARNHLIVSSKLLALAHAVTVAAQGDRR